MCHTPSSDDEPGDFTIRRIQSESGGFFEIIETPWHHADQPEPTPEEQIEAARHYMITKYGEGSALERMISGEITPTEAQAEVIENITSGIYDKMVHRNPDGSDPLVQEPKT